jgi:hypothetical protein
MFTSQGICPIVGDDATAEPAPNVRPTDGWPKPTRDLLYGGENDLSPLDRQRGGTGMGQLLGRLATVTVMALALVALVVPPAHAYLDPASGSLILQALAAAAMAAALFFRIAWRRIKNAVSSVFNRTETEEP